MATTRQKHLAGQILAYLLASSVTYSSTLPQSLWGCAKICSGQVLLAGFSSAWLFVGLIGFRGAKP